MYGRGSRRRSSYYSGRSSSAGREAARLHIREAGELSQLLGGTDRTVKQYLFGLSGGTLEAMLTEYGRRYGELARSYAEETLPRWRSGAVSMSGMVAARLYRLLPPRMPIKIKYQIAEELWHHVGPSSQKTLRFGPDVEPQEVVVQVGQHIEDVVQEYRIPDALERRFDWLASGDVGFKQQLLNHLRSLDKSLVVEAARLQVDVMFRQSFGESAKEIQRFTHTLSVSKHLLKLVADPGASGWAFEDYSAAEPRTASHDSDYSWLIVPAIAALIAFIVWLANSG